MLEIEMPSPDDVAAPAGAEASGETLPGGRSEQLAPKAQADRDPPKRLKIPEGLATTRSGPDSPGKFEAIPLLFRAVITAVGAFIVYWIVDKIFIYRTSAGYIDEIAQAYDLNRNLTTAFTIALFVVLAIVANYTFSFSRKKRYTAWVVLAAALVAHSLILWNVTRRQFFSRSGEAIKCYIVTRKAITYGERPGVDPATGRKCRMITPEIVERIKEYENGRRPGVVSTPNPTFFDLGTGEPVVWYGQNTVGGIELFDLMGFHPQTGAELQPIDQETIAKWQKQQNAAQAVLARRAPLRVDPEKYGFFDSVTGAPRVWYWRRGEGDYEFYDADGFHKETGERLRVITPEVLEQRRLELRAVERKRSELELQRQQEEREKAERAEHEREQALAMQRKQQADAQAQAERTAAQARAESERQQAAAGSCDRLAANPNDRRKPSNIEGAAYETLKLNRSEAISTCRLAVTQYPNELRYQYQLGRALQSEFPHEAFGLYINLVSKKYPAAYDNLGWLHVRLNKNYDEAVRVFRGGAQLGDPDSLVSLAEMVERRYHQPSSAAESKWQLLARAASLGHANAAQAVERERLRVEGEMAEQQRQQETSRAILQLFGGVIQSIPRR